MAKGGDFETMANFLRALMRITPDGWLQSPDIKILKSPNFDLRPTGEVISLLVIHCISLPPGEFGSGAVQDLFMNVLDCESENSHPYFQQELKNKKLSSHVFINRSGEVFQFVSFKHRAWHAGVSSFKDKDKCNDYSIGIELEGTEDQKFESAQYESLITLTKIILKTYPAINLSHIQGHEDIAPGRKTDPGKYFDWGFYKKELLENG